MAIGYLHCGERRATSVVVGSGGNLLTASRAHPVEPGPDRHGADRTASAVTRDSRTRRHPVAFSLALTVGLYLIALFVGQTTVASAIGRVWPDTDAQVATSGVLAPVAAMTGALIGHRPFRHRRLPRSVRIMTGRSLIVILAADTIAFSRGAEEVATPLTILALTGLTIIMTATSARQRRVRGWAGPIRHKSSDRKGRT